MLKRLISLSLLCIAGHAYSDNIIVNTTEDDNAANDKCSLREAIALINSTGTDGKIPEAGYQGCVGKEASPIIVLESGKTYTVDKGQIDIKKALSINSLPDSQTSLNFKGEKNATIKVIGSNRLFNIDDNNPNIASFIVSIDETDIIGCAADKATTICDQNGGIIFNRENLKISYSRITNGRASVDGGAIFNAGIADSSSSNSSAAAFLTLNNVFMANNSAVEGAGVYSSQPRYTITNSVFKDNTASAANGAVVHVGQSVLNPPKDGEEIPTTRTAQIFNSTFFNNTAFAANLLDAMIINNSTIVRNRAGVLLNAKSGVANLSNSIVAGNTNSDCTIGSENNAKTNNIVFSKAGCDIPVSTQTDNPNYQLTTADKDKLFANIKIGGADGKIIEGECDKPPAFGLLCPFRTEKEVFNGYFKPRLLVAYENISQSPIVNRGRINNDGSTTNTLACISNDQRGKARETNVLCDIGAIELTIGTTSLVGQDILYGQVAEIDLSDNLGDGELWPAGSCEEVLGKRADGAVWQDGCLNTATDSPVKKGQLTLNSDALLKYTPFSNYHGKDTFSFRIMTTTSRFSAGDTNKTILLNGAIVQDPPNNFENKTVNTSGGSVGLIGMLGMMSLVWIRRRLQGE